MGKEIKKAFACRGMSKNGKGVGHFLGVTGGREGDGGGEGGGEGEQEGCDRQILRISWTGAIIHFAKKIYNRMGGGGGSEGVGRGGDRADKGD